MIPYKFSDQSKARKVCPQTWEFWYSCTGKCNIQCNFVGLGAHFPGLKLIPNLVWVHILTHKIGWSLKHKHKKFFGRPMVHTSSISITHSPFLKAESEPRFWLSSQRTDGSSFSSKSQFFDCGSSSELNGTTFTSLWGHEIFTSVWNFFNFWGETFFFELFFYFLEFFGFTLHFRPFQAKKK